MASRQVRALDVLGWRSVGRWIAVRWIAVRLVAVRGGGTAAVCLATFLLLDGLGSRLSFAQSVAEPSKNCALMIAVDRYDHAFMNAPQLKFPEKDAQALGNLLKDAGYEVEYLLGLQATRRSIMQKMAQLNQKGHSSGVCVIGLFGHGVEAEFVGSDQTYEIHGCYCPVDTKIRQLVNRDNQTQFDNWEKPLLEPVPDSLVKMTEVVNALTIAKAGSRLLVADCCRKMTHRARGGNLGLGANFNTDRLPDQTVMLFGCRPGEECLERDDWGHGAFTKALLEELSLMQQSGEAVTSGTLADRVKRRTQALTGQQQNPTSISLDSIDLLLTSTAARAIPATLRAPFSEAEASLGQANWAKYLGVAVRSRNSVGMEMVLTPPGEFLMGSAKDDKSGFIAEKPQHRVTLTKAFLMAESEVTQGQWKAVMGTEPWKGKPNVTEGANYPATFVGHEDTEEFCRRLSEKDGRTYRLPTEAEWEYACRAGTTTKYSFGDYESGLGQYGWFSANKSSNPHRVKQKSPNPFGLYDMHGNVWEWCSDRYAPYQARALLDPTVADKGLFRVTRGGSWYDEAAVCRSATRSWLDPSYRNIILGFRVVLSSPSGIPR